jgi:glutamate-ammonia-ligase adenylyltransferase
MGKLGGGELNFSSDIDLIYVYIPEETEAPGMDAPEYFRILCGKITAALDAFTEQGYVYRVDLRLRPDGASGPMASPLGGAARYYGSRAETWERLALLKARPVAGNRAVGRAFLNMTRAFAYGGGFDDRARAYVRDMKRRIDRELASRGEGGHNVKLGTGGIREIELVVQSLQVRHGAGLPRIRQRNTLAALRALCGAGFLDAGHWEALTSAYRFLRDVENKLQMVDDAQTHALPRDAEELTACARRLGYFDGEEGPGAARLIADHRRHTAAVKRIFEEVCGAGVDPSC